MAAKKYVPSMSDATVKSRTGKDWQDWFAALDGAGAAKMKHGDIVEMLSETHGMPGWWSQMVTVEYERARGLRQRYETATGFQVAASRTLGASLAKVYAATSQPTERNKWFPKGAFELSSKTKDKYFRGAWKRTARLEIGFYGKGPGKAQIAVQISKLAKKGDVEVERAAWKAALVKLQSLVT